MSSGGTVMSSGEAHLEADGGAELSKAVEANAWGGAAIGETARRYDIA